VTRSGIRGGEREWERRGGYGEHMDGEGRREVTELPTEALVRMIETVVGPNRRVRELPTEELVSRIEDMTQSTCRRIEGWRSRGLTEALAALDSTESQGPLGEGRRQWRRQWWGWLGR